MTLGATTVVALIGLAAVTSLRIQRRSVQGLMGFSEARLFARSAIDIGLRTVNTDSNWRSTMPNGVWHTDALLVSGSITFNGTRAIRGVIFSSNVRANSTLTVTHDPTLIDSPAPGFERALRPMQAVTGSWK